MFVLHIDLTLEPGKQQALRQSWRDAFYPAVASQAGFAEALLLYPTEGAAPYRIVLVFDQQSSQQAWAASELHQQVWPLIAAHCKDLAVKGYNTI